MLDETRFDAVDAFALFVLFGGRSCRSARHSGCCRIVVGHRDSSILIMINDLEVRLFHFGMTTLLLASTFSADVNVTTLVPNLISKNEQQQTSISFL